MLTEYKELAWEGKGVVKWSHLVALNDVRECHGLKLGNKLTAKHVQFKFNEMKVASNVITIADSPLDHFEIVC